jgi:hypothetical protein
MRGTTIELLWSPQWYRVPTVRRSSRCAWGFYVAWKAGFHHKAPFPPTQRQNGRAFVSLTARGGGLPVGVTWNTHAGAAAAPV